MTNAYRCWIVGRKDRTWMIIEASSSFAARKQLAQEYGPTINVTDVVAERI